MRFSSSVRSPVASAPAFWPLDTFDQYIIPVSYTHLQAAISGHMATLSFKNNRKILWDEKGEKYQFV